MPNKINQASKDAIEAGVIHPESQLNPADAGYIDKTGKEVPPFDPDAIPEGSEANPADVKAAEAAKSSASKKASKKSGK